MAVAIRMPMPGQMTEECTVLRWYKAEGEAVSRGDPLFEIETDKSNMEIEAFDEGVLLRIDAPEGSTVPVESIVAWIGQPGEVVPEGPRPGPEGPTSGRGPTLASRIGAAASQQKASTGRIAISPRASRVAAELGINPRDVRGSGPGGRVVERDVRSAAAAQGPGWAASIGSAVAQGPGSAAAVGPAASSGQTARVAPGASRPAGAEGAGEPLSRMRQTIARRLSDNASVPTFDITVAVDMTGLLRLRAELKASSSEITVTDFIHAGAVQTLGEFPLLNASTDGSTVWRREHVQLGVAVSVPTGLLVPVVRDADLLSIRGLHDRTAEVVRAAREGTLGPDALSGSTFTVSNMGMFGIEQFTAIINPGESAILAVSSVGPEPRVLGDGIAVRQMMRITLTADHRLIDGEMGARFANAVRRRLEDAAAFRDQVPTG